MPDKANKLSSRERKKDSLKKHKENNIYNSKHIREKEDIILSGNNNKKIDNQQITVIK